MQSRQVIRALLRQHRPACMVVTGCYAQTEPLTVAGIEGVDYVLGHAEKFRLAQIILPLAERQGTSAKVLCENIAAAGTFEPSGEWSTEGARSRAFLKIQDGCNANCTYCIVPAARGASRSMPPDRVYQRLAAQIAAGYKEIVLTGIHLGLYGIDAEPPSSLLHLLQHIAAQAPAARLRLSSLEPPELSEALLATLSTASVFCPHLHVPLQSGDDTVLTAMGRPYTREVVRARIQAAVELMPDVAVGMDVMAGFPGESARAFEQTCDLLQMLPVSYLHVFPFSVRPQTKAAGMQPQISQRLIKARCRRLRELGKLKKLAFWEKNLRQRRQVLVENRRDTATGLLKGLTDNYIPVLLPGDDKMRNQFVTVKLEAIQDDRAITGKAEGAGDKG